MILEINNRNHATFINETTKSKYTIYYKQDELAGEKTVNYYFLYDDTRLFVLNGYGLKYEFYKFFDLEEEEEENNLEIFCSSYCHTADFGYEVILKVFRCFLTNQNNVLLNEKNFTKIVLEEFKMIYDTILLYNLNNK